MANIQSNINQLLSTFATLKGIKKFGERQKEDEAAIRRMTTVTLGPTPEEALKKNEAAWLDDERAKSEASFEQGKRAHFFREYKRSHGWPEPAKHPKGIDFYEDEETGRFITVGAAAERLNTVETAKEFRRQIFNKPQKIGTDIETIKPQKIGGNK
jgi:hypothetical protein